LATKAPDVAYVDTNVLVGLFAAPDHALHDRALDLFRRVADGDVALILTSVITAELCFVGNRVLGWSRPKVADTLSRLLEADGLIVPEAASLHLALDLYGRHRRLAFPDAYLAARALRDGPTVIATFDRAIGSLPGIRVLPRAETHRVAEPKVPLFESRSVDLAAREDEHMEGFGESSSTLAVRAPAAAQV